MEKISSQNVQGVLKTAAETIRAFEAENHQLKSKVASYEKKERIEKIARDMEEKGLNAEMTFSEKVASLQNQDLVVAEQAVKMAAPQRGGGIKLSDGDKEVTASAASALEQYILTGDAPSDD
jgi:DNA polymerase sigma